jgi:CspA family cold shock protein
VAVGTVKSSNHTKRFGFIRPEDGSQDVFLHASAVAEGVALSALKTGRKVRFDLVRGRNGKATARNLQVIS